MGASAVLDFGWHGASIVSSDEFYENWSTKKFGAKPPLRLRPSTELTSRHRSISRARRNSSMV